MRTPGVKTAWFAFVLSLVGTAALAQPPADHVVLISIDGLRPEFYRDASWPAPMIQQMAREGVNAERVRSVFPSVTYPSHTTMITGALPARHGVYYNQPLEPTGQTGRWYWEAESIRVPTLWHAARQAGLRTAAFSWPVTVGAPIDLVVPEVWSLDPDSDRLAPMREGTSPASLWGELEREATGKLDRRSMSALYMNRDDTTGRAASYLLQTYKPALLALHLLSADHFQHETGRNSDFVRRAVSANDRAISALVEAAERAGILERTAFVVTGDHGFVDYHLSLAPNVWLVQAGLSGSEKDRGDWRATFHTQGGGAFLHLRRAGDAEAVEQVRKLLAAQPESMKRLFRVVEREELDSAGTDPRVPLALAASLGVEFVSRGDGEVLGPGHGGDHGYFPTDFPEIATGFVGWGAGFEPGVVVHEIALQDIAPIVAHLLGLPFQAPDGIAPLGVFKRNEAAENEE